MGAGPVFGRNPGDVARCGFAQRNLLEKRLAQNGPGHRREQEEGQGIVQPEQYILRRQKGLQSTEELPGPEQGAVHLEKGGMSFLESADRPHGDRPRFGKVQHRLGKSPGVEEVDAARQAGIAFDGTRNTLSVFDEVKRDETGIGFSFGKSADPAGRGRAIIDLLERDRNGSRIDPALVERGCQDFAVTGYAERADMSAG